MCRDFTVGNRFDANGDHRIIRTIFNINTRHGRSKMTKTQKYPTIEILRDSNEKFQDRMSSGLKEREYNKYGNEQPILLHNWKFRRGHKWTLYETGKGKQTN